MSGARDASVDAYHDLRGQEEGQLQQFERYIRDHGPCTRAMAGAALGYPANVYSARVNLLLKDNKVVEEAQKRPCEITGFTVNWLVHRQRVTLDGLGIETCVQCEKQSGEYDLTKLCCASRHALCTTLPQHLPMAVEAIAHRWGHDLEVMKLAVNAWHRRIKARADARAMSRPANDEVAQ